MLLFYVFESRRSKKSRSWCKIVLKTFQSRIEHLSSITFWKVQTSGIIDIQLIVDLIVYEHWIAMYAIPCVLCKRKFSDATYFVNGLFESSFCVISEKVSSAIIGHPRYSVQKFVGCSVTGVVTVSLRFAQKKCKI